MNNVKNKLQNPNRLTARQFNGQLIATTPSLTTFLPFHPKAGSRAKSQRGCKISRGGALFQLIK